MWNNNISQFAIGIDVGTKTGLAIWDKAKKKYVEIKTLPIHRALDVVKDYHSKHKIIVIVEDARKVRFGTDKVKAQGAGSVKRDSSIWDDFLTDYNIPHAMARPNKRITKWDATTFRMQTGYEGLTSSHSRDAALLVFQY